MEWSKIKNIIILMLLTVNLFLLVLVVQRQSQTSMLTEKAVEDGIKVLAQNGIRVSRKVLPANTTFYSIEVSRDRTREAKIAESILGQVSITEPGGGVVSYSGANGSAVFRSGGEFTFTFHPGYSTAGKEGVLAHAMKLLSAMQFDTSADSVTVREESGVTKITAIQEIDGVQVFNCTAVFTYEGPQLQSVWGKRLMGEPRKKGTEKNSTSILTMLFQLLRHVNQEGDVCNEITKIVSGYQMPSSLTEPMQFSPVWKITTDTGLYYFNADSGAVERASQS